jgi:predicted TIM-barrel fold metal-dependent hydrolase
MFASNFPVDSLVGDFTTIYAGFIEATLPLGRETQEKLFAGTARRLYRIGEERQG